MKLVVDLTSVDVQGSFNLALSSAGFEGSD